MPYREKSVYQKTLQKQSHLSMSEEGLIELDDSQLESIVGGKGSPAEAQLRHDEGVLAALQIENSRPITVNNDPKVTNTVIANSQSVGVGGITNKYK